MCHPRLAVSAGSRAKATIMQSFAGTGDYFCNCVSRAVLAEGSHLQHYYLQEQSLSAHHIDTVLADLATNATYTANMMASGSRNGRANIQIELGQTGAHTELRAAALTDGKQFIDYHTQLGHGAESTTSIQQQRNILAGSSECIFRGRIRVDQVAQKTDAFQICRTLMLSDKARVTAMPSLEITADDVKCAHGATITDLDEESLFYLAARGINAAQARATVIRGFAFDMIKSYPDPKAQKRILNKLLAMTPSEGRSVAAEGAFSSI